MKKYKVLIASTAEDLEVQMNELVEDDFVIFNFTHTLSIEHRSPFPRQIHKFVAVMEKEC